MEKEHLRSRREILLLQPWVEDFYATDCRSLPMGLAYLAASIKKSLPDHKVFLYDFFSPSKRRTISLPKELGYLKRYYGTHEKSPSALFHNYFRFGTSENEIIETIQAHRPMLIGISSLFSPYYRESVALAALCKNIFPDIPIVMGGNHASLSPDTLLFQKHDVSTSGYSCDYIIRGEGEESIVSLILAIENGHATSSVPNLVNRTNMLTSMNLPLKPIDRDTIPLPDFCNLDLSKYSYGGRPLSFLLTSRSCPYNCNFCSIHAVFGRTYTSRSNKDILFEIKHFYSQGIRHFDIEDDNFTFDEKKCADLLDSIVRLNLPDISFSAMNGLSYTTLTSKILRKMKAAGFSNLNLSLVSSQEHIQKSSHRPIRGEQLDSVLSHSQRLGFHTVVYFIINLPAQSLEEAVETLCYLAARQCLIGPSPFYLTPNSPIDLEYRHTDTLRLASAGKDRHFSARLTALDVEKSGFNRDELYTIFRLTRVINYCKKLLDDKQTEDNTALDNAVTALSSGFWQTEIKDGAPPPFAQSVHTLLKKHLSMISGYKTSTSCHINL